jgi:phosphopantetheine adenylyltransferase
MAEFNKSKNPKLDTVLLFPEKELGDVSSTAIYDMIKSGGCFEKYIPNGALQILKKLI